LEAPGRVQVTRCKVHTSSLARRIKLLWNCTTWTSSSDGNVKKMLLHPMRINIPEGSITAILGNADSRKPTLLKFIAGCLDKNCEIAHVYCSFILRICLNTTVAFFHL
jgi:ABC-type polysaccharide/polyol phosphate transport system ATPase subunit